jgi:hypothetical protein
MRTKTPTPPTSTSGAKRAWVRPELKPAGTVGELLQGGGGKLSPSPKDPGEDRKVPAQE